MLQSRIWISCLSVAGLLSAFFSCENRVPESLKPIDDSLQTQTIFIGSAACKQCHSSEYKDWLSSDHYLAMQEANNSSFLGLLNSSPIKLDGVVNQVYAKDHQYLLKTKETNGSENTYTLSYTFGYFPLQQYLVKTERGQLQATRLSWDSRNQKWFHQYPGQRINSEDWLHWTGNSQNWNTMCASCHSTNFKKNYDFETDTYASTFSEINVACESCHGAGGQHLAYIQSEDYIEGKRIPNSGLHYAKNNNNTFQLNTCAPCHARKSDISEASVSSSELLDHLIPELISNEHYFADGQINDEDYEYGSFAQSKMFHNNVKCSDCHNPHSGKLKKEGNAMCLSCHEPKYDSEAHHFHKGSGESTKCISCHMPEKTYMGNDHRRDHSFRIPRPDQSMVYQTPNTCNACHSKQTAKWASEAITQWYGKKRAYHFSDDLLPGSLVNKESKTHLLKLAADTSQPEIARATALYYLGNYNDEETAEVLLLHSRDEKPLVRYHAFRSLENFPNNFWAHAATHGLTDKVRAVRIAAADLYHLAGEQQVPEPAKASYAKANAENKAYLRYQRDFAIGNVMMADYHLQEGDYKNAIVHYLRGLKKDSLMNYARFNLSAAYSSGGKNKEALSVLQDAVLTDPQNDRSYYDIALLYYELGDTQSSLNNFKKAYSLHSQNSDVYYNYGLLLQQNLNSSEAERVFLRGIEINPNSEKLNYALCSFYLQNKNNSKAQKFASRLYQLNPLSKEYQDIYRIFNL
jgi:predicted CXXCH cytochrome family protein